MRAFFGTVALIMATMFLSVLTCVAIGWDPSPGLGAVLFGVFPVIGIPVIVLVVRSIRRRHVNDALLLPQIYRTGFRIFERLDLPRVSLLIDREHSVLCIAYAEGLMANGLSVHLYPASRLLGCDIERDTALYTDVSTTTYSHTDRLRSYLTGVPNATISHAYSNVTQRTVVTSLTLRILIDDEHRRSHRIDFLRLLWSMNAVFPRVRRAQESIEAWQLKINMLMSGDAAPAMESLADLKDFADVTRLKRQRGLFR